MYRERNEKGEMEGGTERWAEMERRWEGRGVALKKKQIIHNLLAFCFSSYLFISTGKVTYRLWLDNLGWCSHAVMHWIGKALLGPVHELHTLPDEDGKSRKL